MTHFAIALSGSPRARRAALFLTAALALAVALLLTSARGARAEDAPPTPQGTPAAEPGPASTPLPADRQAALGEVLGDDWHRALDRSLPEGWEAAVGEVIARVKALPIPIDAVVANAAEAWALVPPGARPLPLAPAQIRRGVVVAASLSALVFALGLMAGLVRAAVCLAVGDRAGVGRSLVGILNAGFAFAALLATPWLIKVVVGFIAPFAAPGNLPRFGG